MTIVGPSSGSSLRSTGVAPPGTTDPVPLRVGPDVSSRSTLASASVAAFIASCDAAAVATSRG